MTIQAFVHLKTKTPSIAAFTDAQKDAMRLHVLPLLNSIDKDGNVWSTKFVLKYVQEKFGPNKGGKWNDTLATGIWYLQTVKAILESVVANRPDTVRARELIKDLVELNKYKHPTLVIDPNKLMLLAFNKIIKIQPQILTDEGRALQDMMRSQYMVLLRKSWPFVVAECYREHEEIMRKFKLTKGVGASLDKIVAAAKLYLEPKGFTFSEDEQERRFNRTAWVAQSNEIKLKFVENEYNAKDKNRDFLIIPSYKDPEKNSWFSWARLGVDGGEMWFDASYSVEHAIDEAIAKCQAAIDRAKKVATEGVEFDFGGGKVMKLMPDRLGQIFNQLKAGKNFEIGPGGFGTYYVFSTRQYRDSKPASQALTTAVGQQVWYITQDRD